jgi:hypothetical protein
MAKPFFKGDPRIGRKKIPPELIEVRCRGKAEIKRLINLYLDLPRDQLKKKIEDPKTPAIELYLASLIAKGIQTSDWRMFAWLLDRIVGPVKTEDVDIAELREQVKAEIELEGMPIEDVRALAARKGRVIDVD